MFVAQIIPAGDATLEARVLAFNAAVPGVAARKGPHTHLVDLRSAITTADLADGLHPTEAGYGRMAARWYSSLQSGPGSLTPVATASRRQDPPGLVPAVRA